MGWLNVSIIDEKCTMMDVLRPWMTSWINNELVNLCVVVPTTIILEALRDMIYQKIALSLEKHNFQKFNLYNKNIVVYMFILCCSYLYLFRAWLPPSFFLPTYINMKRYINIYIFMFMLSKLKSNWRLT
jgi:hypothetical protein